MPDYYDGSLDYGKGMPKMTVNAHYAQANCSHICVILNKNVQKHKILLAFSSFLGYNNIVIGSHIIMAAVFSKKEEVVMFQKGDFVTYGCKGVCEIKDVTTLKMDGVPKDKLYYEMQLLLDAGSKIFTPVEHESSKNVMRSVLTSEEAKELLDELPQLEELWVKEDRAREEKYRSAINHSDAKAMLSMIRSLYGRKKERVALGRKLAALDSKYLRIAEDNLFSELSLSLQVTQDRIEKYVAEKIQQLEGTVKNA